MSHTKRHLTRPRPGPDWVVQDVTRYASWREGVDECAACGADVDLSDDHVGMELLRVNSDRAAGKRGLERERFAFCSMACADRWTDA
jgi:hypothetical protein